MGQAKRYLPLQRGFDAFYGHGNNGIDYYTHERHDGRMTPDFNCALERAHDSGGERHAIETRPRVSGPGGQAQLT